MVGPPEIADQLTAGFLCDSRAKAGKCDAKLSAEIRAWERGQTVGAGDWALGVTIVVVTYKRDALLQVLLDSIRDLTVKPGRLVVVDNDNSPSTSALVSDFARGNNDAIHVTYEGQQENSGGAGGFSRGVELAMNLGSEWVWLMDDDVALLPDALEKIAPWAERFAVVQGRRYDYDGSPFYWQYRFNTALGIPNPVARSTFGASGYFEMNTACFEGTMFRKDIVEEIGLPDPRFFIYWDDTVYGWLASRVTSCVLVDEFVMRRTRTIKQLDLGVRHLNGTSDMVRYHIMRNRGYMAKYFALHGAYYPVLFGIGTALTFAKELIRIATIDKSWRNGVAALFRGVRDARRIRRDRTWHPMPGLEAD